MIWNNILKMPNKQNYCNNIKKYKKIKKNSKRKLKNQKIKYLKNRDLIKFIYKLLQ